MFDAGKTRMIGLPYGKKNYDDMLSRFHLIPVRYGRTYRQTDRRTDRQTDGQIFYINIARGNADARLKQEALLSQRGRAMLRVCIASIH